MRMLNETSRTNYRSISWVKLVAMLRWRVRRWTAETLRLSGRSLRFTQRLKPSRFDPREPVGETHTEGRVLQSRPTHRPAVMLV